MATSERLISPQALPSGGNRLYQTYDVDEESVRASSHYEQKPEFFYLIIGGEWHTYSCSLSADSVTATEAQERKLDLLAREMQLQPGMRILDVGCGWGGPLVYLCRKYGVTGRGIAVTDGQIDAARQLAARYGVDATFELRHWLQLDEQEAFDAVYTDETMVHFQDLGAFFAKCRQVLKLGSLMVHKELHLTHSSYSELGPMSRYVNQIYGFTGNYIPLHRELRLLDENAFQLRHLVDIPMEHYRLTLDTWLRNMFEHRDRLAALASPQLYRDFRVYLKTMRYLFTHTEIFGLHVVTSRRMD